MLSAETGTHVSKLTWDQCPAGWLMERVTKSTFICGYSRCQPPCVQPMSCDFPWSLDRRRGFFCSLQTWHLLVETCGTPKTDNLLQHKTICLIIYKTHTWWWKSSSLSAKTWWDWSSKGDDDYRQILMWPLWSGALNESLHLQLAALKPSVAGH